VGSYFAGVDIGHCQVKAILRGPKVENERCFRSQVAVVTTDDIPQVKARLQDDFLKWGRKSFLTGDRADAINRHRDTVGDTPQWVLTEDHEVLLVSALKRLFETRAAKDDEVFLTVGLPAEVFVRHPQLRSVLGTEASRIARRILGCEVKAFVQAQPVAAFVSWAFDTEGVEKEDKAGRRCGIIDVGQGSTDFTVVIDGAPQLEFTSSCGGVDVIVPHINSVLGPDGMKVRAADLERHLRDGLSIRGEKRDVRELIRSAVLEQLLPMILRHLDSRRYESVLQEVDCILVAGGGADLVFADLKQRDQTRHAVRLDSPLLAVADGLAKYSALRAGLRHAA
jgi:hypothetical protein